MKKVFVILALIAAFALAAEVVTIPLMANSQTVVENTDIQSVGGDNAIIAALLSCLVPGLGQMFIGKLKRGLMIFGGFFVLYILQIIIVAVLSSISTTLASIVSCIFSLAIFVGYFWQIYDAFKLAGGDTSDLEDAVDDDDDDTFLPSLRPVSVLR